MRVICRTESKTPRMGKRGKLVYGEVIREMRVTSMNIKPTQKSNTHKDILSSKLLLLQWRITQKEVNYVNSQGLLGCIA